MKLTYLLLTFVILGGLASQVIYTMDDAKQPLLNSDGSKRYSSAPAQASRDVQAQGTADYHSSIAPNTRDIEKGIPNALLTIEVIPPPATSACANITANTSAPVVFATNSSTIIFTNSSAKSITQAENHRSYNTSCSNNHDEAAQKKKKGKEKELVATDVSSSNTTTNPINKTSNITLHGASQVSHETQSTGKKEKQSAGVESAINNHTLTTMREAHDRLEQRVWQAENKVAILQNCIIALNAWIRDHNTSKPGHSDQDIISCGCPPVVHWVDLQPSWRGVARWSLRLLELLVKYTLVFLVAPFPATTDHFYNRLDYIGELPALAFFALDSFSDTLVNIFFPRPSLILLIINLVWMGVLAYALYYVAYEFSILDHANPDHSSFWKRFQSDLQDNGIYFFNVALILAICRVISVYFHHINWDPEHRKFK